MTTSTENYESRLKAQIAGAYARALHLKPLSSENGPSLQDLQIAIATATVEELRALDVALETAGIDEYLHSQEAPTDDQRVEGEPIVAYTTGMADDDELTISPEALQRGLLYSAAMMKMAGPPITAATNSESPQKITIAALGAILRAYLQQVDVYVGDLVGMVSPLTSQARASGSADLLRIPLPPYDHVDIYWDEAARNIDVSPTRDDTTLLLLCALSSETGQPLDLIDDKGTTTSTIEIGVNKRTARFPLNAPSVSPTFLLFTPRTQRVGQ